MRRNGLLVSGWTLATILALVLGLQGVHSVSTTVMNSRPAPLSPASVRAALQRANASSASTSAGSTASDDASGSIASASNDAADDHGSRDQPPSSAGLVPPSDSDGGTRQSAASEPSSLSSESHDGDFSSGSDGADSSLSNSTVSQPVDRTYELIGGSVGVRFENGTARVLWIIRNPGYYGEASNDGGQVDVKFDNGEHESRLHAWWDNGPQQQIEERSSD